MSLALYAKKAEELAQELIESLTESEIEDLRSQLQGLTIQQWQQWRVECQVAIAEFAASTPSQRAKKARWKEMRAGLALAAAQLCLESAALQKATLRLRQTQPGASYRDMTTIAGVAYQEVMAAEIPVWPLAGQSPFVD